MNATARSRKLRRKAIAVLIAACYSSVYAAPVSPAVVAGQASFNVQGKTYTVTNTPNTIINWQGFSIAADELTRFVQQSADSKVLNRITGQDPSLILGALQSNGKVFLINPNGVMFGAGSRVDVNGLVASSLNISNADFLAGKNNFNGAAGAGKVSNQGTITTPSGGQIFLVAPAVENSGVISAPNGEVLLAAGHTVQLFDSSDPNVQVVVSSPSDQALNLGQVVAQGGRIGVYGALVNQRGSINANSAVRGANGKIVLKASGTMLAEAGSQTTAAGSNLNTGGEILLLGAQVGLTGNAVVDASGAAGGGTVLVGGDYQGKNPAVRNAQQAYVGKEALIRADAQDNGNGGKVVVWSDAATQVFGAISARGGAAGGNGGMVETSGHYLDMQGKVDTRAPKGANGSLLLDPSDVYIALDASTARDAGMEIGATLPLSGGVFLETTAVKDSLLLTSVLQTALLTSDVTVSTANSSGTGTGVISVLSPLLWVTSRNLSLNADSDIQIKSSITGINGALNLTAGGAIVQTTSPIDAMAVSSLNAIAAGAITLDNNANTIGGSAALAANGGNATLTAVNVNLGASNAAGSMTVTAYNGDLNVNGGLSAGSGITLQSSKANGTLTIASGQTVSASAGDVSFVADKMNLLGSASVSTTHALSLQPYQDSVNVLVGGSAADASGTLGLSQAELQRMSVPSNGLLQIGTSFTNTAASGTLTVSGALDLSAMGGGGLLLQSQAGDLSINSGAALTVPGVISLQTVPTGSHRVTNVGTVTSSSGINVYAGKMTLAGGTLNAYAVGLESGNDIDLGATSAGSGTLALASSDLNSVNATLLNVSINSSHSGSGDITVSAPLSLTAPSLTLTPQRNIALDASLTTSGSLALNAPGSISADGAVAVGGTFELLGGDWVQNSASLPAFSAGDFKLSGGSFVRVQGGDGSLSTPYQLADIYGLQGAATLGGATSYVLNNNIDASASGSWSGSFVPLASGGYTGVFDGAGHTISGLSISRASEDNVGLFGRIDTGTVRDLTLSDVFAQGGHNVGGLAGVVSDGIGYINNVSVSGTVSGVGNVGLLIGRNGGLVSNAHSSGTVYGTTGATASNIGGLVGASSGQISDAWSDAGVHTTGDGYAGGLVGSNFASDGGTGSITRSYASGTVYSSGEIVGGLVGDNRGGTVTLSYATASVSGGRNVGGLAGRNTSGGTIYNVYASGDVHGNSDSAFVSHANIGGLIGELYSGYISSVYSSGSVDPGSFSSIGGLIGSQPGGSLSAGYFNQEAAGTSSDAAGAVGLTAAQMLKQSSFAGFNFDDGPEWRIYDGHTVPLLKNFLTPYEVVVSGGGSVSKVYDGESATFSGSTGTLPAAIHGTLGFDGAVNAGTYSVGGLWSTSYDISYSGSSATLTIDPRPVTAVVTATKTYDGGTGFSGTPSVSFSSLVGSDTLGLAGVIHFDNKHAGSGKVLSFGDVALTDNPFGNYTLAGGGVSGTGTINPAALAVSGVTVNTRTYNGEVGATLSGTPGATPLSGDVVTVSLVGSGSASFGDKNVGSGKAVTVNAASFSLAGADAGNYVVLAPTGLTGEITPALLGIAGMTASDRVYNVDYDPVSHTYGQKATVSGGTLSGVFGSDNVTIESVSATFGDKNVGSAKPVAIGAVTLGGTDKNNYTMGPLPLDLTASITPATISVTLASRVYNNSTAGTFAGATLNGVLGSEALDDVALSAGGSTATYADKNVGTAKLVTVGGSALALTGADAGNYVLAPTVTGDITARALATWTASGAGLWSDSANWADGVAPSGANVLAATLGSSAGLVTYDTSAGTTTLVTLSSGGTPLTLTGGKLSLTGSGYDASYVSGPLTHNGGTLEVVGKLSASNLVLASGTVSGAGSGSYIYVNNLNQTGGIIDSTGTVYLGSGGNIATGNIRAHSLTMNAGEGGVVSQNSGSQLVVDMLSVTASGDITLFNDNNHVGAFDAHIYGNGNITFKNVSNPAELQLGPLYTNGNIVIDNTGGVHTVGAITANKVGAGTGVISIAAHSPVKIDSTLTGADIGLSASTDIVLGSGSALSSSHSIGMTAGTNIMLGGSLSVPAGGSISAVATTGSITSAAGTHISSGGSPVTLSAPMGSVSTAGTSFGADTVATISDGSAAAAAAAEAAAKAAAEAAAKAAADAAAAAAAEAAAKAAADAAAAAAAEAAAKAAADAAAKAAADAAAKAAADAAAAEAAAKAAADAAAAEAAAKAAAEAAAKAAADAAKAAADAAAKAAADAAAQSQQNQPVAQAINSTVNIINASVNSSQNKGGSTATVPEQHVATSAGSSGNSAPDDKTVEDKNVDGSAKTTAGTAKEQVKKMYCN